MIEVEFCPHCSLRIADPKCPHCSAKVRYDWGFCTTCGRGLESLDQQMDPVAKDPEPPVKEEKNTTKEAPPMACRAITALLHPAQWEWAQALSRNEDFRQPRRILGDLVEAADLSQVVPMEPAGNSEWAKTAIYLRGDCADRLRADGRGISAMVRGIVQAAMEASG